MKNIKAFAFDMDGTLLHSYEKGVSKENIKAIKEAQEAGYEIIIATGRGISQTLPTAKVIGNIKYFVSNNGACVYDVKNQTNLTTEFIDPSLMNQIMQYGKQTNSLFVFHTMENVYSRYYTDIKNRPEWLDTSAAEDRKDYSDEEIKKIADGQIITQLTLKNSKEIIAKIYPIIKKEIGDKYAVHIANEVYLDINPKGSSKLGGLELVSNKLGISLKEIMSFGDSGNDIQMIKGTGYGVAMGNATPELKDLAKEVIGNHQTDAIAKKIREVLALD